MGDKTSWIELNVEIRMFWNLERNREQFLGRCLLYLNNCGIDLDVNTKQLYDF